MAKVEAIIIAKRPDLAGKIDWDTMHYIFFNTGLDVPSAAARYLDAYSWGSDEQ